MIRRTAAPRGGFTMVELLVVIAIIAILVSLLVVGTTRVIHAGRRTAATTEMAQIGNAIATFKTKMNVAYIPCAGGGKNGTFQLKPTYIGTEPEAAYFKQLFPQMDGCAGSGNTGLPDVSLDANQTLLFFLTGGSNVVGTVPNQGFSNNRKYPFSPIASPNENRLGPFLDLPARYKPGLASTATPTASPLANSLVDVWGAPYAYFAWHQPLNTYPSGLAFGFNKTTVHTFLDGNNVPLQPKGFQLISAGEYGSDPAGAGLPGGFGTGGTAWTPGSGEYAEGYAGADDLANFNGGTQLVTKNN